MRYSTKNPIVDIMAESPTHPWEHGSFLILWNHIPGGGDSPYWRIKEDLYRLECAHIARLYTINAAWLLYSYFDDQIVLGPPAYESDGVRTVYAT